MRKRAQTVPPHPRKESLQKISLFMVNEKNMKTRKNEKYKNMLIINVSPRVV